MHTTALLNTHWEFTRGVEDDKGSFIQKVLKVCKTFKVKSLKTPKLDVPAKKTYARDKRRVKGCHHFQGKCHHIEGMGKS